MGMLIAGVLLVGLFAHFVASIIVNDDDPECVFIGAMVYIVVCLSIGLICVLVKDGLVALL